MLLRYKGQTETFHGSRFNTMALNEVLTGDDSAYIHDLDVYLPKKKEWKCLQQAFKDNDVIPDNYNEWFGEPRDEEDRQRGYFDNRR